MLYTLINLAKQDSIKEQLFNGEYKNAKRRNFQQTTRRNAKRN